MTVRIGLTGPIGCGKSTISGWLASEPRVTAIDADAVAREVLAPGTVETERVAARFGAHLVAADGTLDRGALGRLVFGDPAALRDLESIVHPGVRPRVLARIAQAEDRGDRAVVIEAIKLVEGGLAELCDEVWLVTCRPSVQLERIVERGLAAGDARARMDAQADLIERLRPRADRVIDTSGEPGPTRSEVSAALVAAIAAGTRAHRPVRRDDREP